MDENNPSSWDDLINEIGATPAPDAGERRRPAIETKFEPKPAKAPPIPKAKPGNWNALADELGVEVPPEEPRAPSPSSRAPLGEVGLGAIEASFAAIEPIESPFEEIIEEEISEVEFAEGDEMLFDDDDSDLADDDSDLTEEEAAEPEDEGDELPPSTLSGEAARSAFEALFQ